MDAFWEYRLSKRLGIILGSFFVPVHIMIPNRLGKRYCPKPDLLLSTRSRLKIPYWFYHDTFSVNKVLFPSRKEKFSILFWKHLCMIYESFFLFVIYSWHITEGCFKIIFRFKSRARILVNRLLKKLFSAFVMSLDQIKSNHQTFNTATMTTDFMVEKQQNVKFSEEWSQSNNEDLNVSSVSWKVALCPRRAS